MRRGVEQSRVRFRVLVVRGTTMMRVMMMMMKIMRVWMIGVRVMTMVKMMMVIAMIDQRWRKWKMNRRILGVGIWAW